jgi:hypothetical protein
MKDLYKIYISTKKKDGTVTKRESITTRAETQNEAINRVISQAKTYYGFKGKVHVDSVFIYNTKMKQYETAR